MIIGIAGQARSGKDTVAGFILEEDPSFTRYNLADPIKACVNEIFGLDERHSGGALKEVTLPIPTISEERIKLTIWKHFHHMMSFTELDVSVCSFLNILDEVLVYKATRSTRLGSDSFYLVSPRELYQWFGTDVIRCHVVDTFWLEIVNTSKNLVIPDIRFENEAAWVRKHGVLIHIEREDATSVAEHISESGVKRLANEPVIVNNGSLGELNREALHVLYDIMEVDNARD